MGDFQKIEDVLSCEIEEIFPENIINKSRKYLLGQRITGYNYNEGKMIQAFVKGSYNYFVTLSVFNGEFYSTCTCSSAGKCKHMAALFQYSKDRLMQEEVINTKSFESDCADLFLEIKKQIGNRNVITNDYYPEFVKVVNEKIDILKNKEEDDFVDYYVALMSAVEKFNFNSYINDKFTFLESYVSSINPSLIIGNINRFFINVKQLLSVVTIKILEVLIDSYVNSLIKSKTIDLQHNKNAIMLINYFYKLKGINNDLKMQENKVIIDYYSGDDNAINEVKSNLHNINYFYAYNNLMMIDGNNKLVDELFEKNYDMLLREKKISYYYLLNILEVKQSLYGDEVTKTFLLQKVALFINDVDEYSLLKDKYQDLFDELFECEFLLAIRKNNNIELIDELIEFDLKYELFKIDLNSLLNNYNIYIERYPYQLMMNLYYHLQNVISKCGYYDYDGNKRIIQMMNKLEQLPLGKYYIFDLYLFAKKLSKDKLATEMKKSIKFISY